MLSVKRLNFKTPDGEILRDISFNLNPGKVFAVLGPNGSGKTTLLKCILGELNSYSGTISIDKGLRISYLPQAPEFDEMPVMEYLLSSDGVSDKLYKILTSYPEDSAEYSEAITGYIDAGGFDKEYEIKKLISNFRFSEADLTRNLLTFSEGEKQIWGLIKILLTGSEIVLMDEPLNHLDISMRLYIERFIGKQKRSGTSFIIVTHDRIFTDRVADQSLYIKLGESIVVDGGFTQMEHNLDSELNSKLELAEEIRRKIKKLEKEITRKKTWSLRKEKEKIGAADKGHIGAVAAKLMKKSIAARNKTDKALKKLKEENPIIEKKINLKFEEYSVPNRHMISAENISKTFKDKKIFSDIDLHFDTNSRLSIIGPNGSGKTTFLQVLLGELEPDAGKLYRNDNVSWLYIPQDIKKFFSEDRLIDNFPMEALGQTIIRKYLGSAKIKGEMVFQSIETLSYGELMRAAIVMAILEKKEFLFLDEPTNHLDIESLKILDILLDNFPGGLLFISHDRQFIVTHSEKIYSLENGQLALF